MLNALSFDVEEHFHVHAFSEVIPKADWRTLESRVVASTHAILELLDRSHTNATFFVLGLVAERSPALIREIHERGHEIASHGYAHDAVNKLSRDEFAGDLALASEAIRSACPAAELAGYRAPSFSIDRSMGWAFEELKSAGFVYDSSVSPASLHDRYGDHRAPRFKYEIPPGLLEVPPSTVRVFGKNLPAAGGGHFRIAPLSLSRRAIRRINNEGHPAVVYLHPWEFDPEQPRVHAAKWSSRFRHSVNIARTAGRLEVLLREFSFRRMDEVYGADIQNLTSNDRPPSDVAAVQQPQREPLAR